MSIKEVAAKSLEDAQVYLGDIDPDIYRMPLELLFNASIGQHTRHFVEFYQCLIDQCTGDSPKINYALRSRDPRIEEDPRFTSKLIRDIQKHLPGLDETKACRLICDEHVDDIAEMSVESNLSRELLYNIEHTVHHLAIIKIGLNAIAPQITLPSHFGVAPSTIRHKEKTCAQ